MYKLILKNKTINCRSLQEWHSQVQKLEKQGLIYKTFKRNNYGYDFYY